QIRPQTTGWRATTAGPRLNQSTTAAVMTATRPTALRAGRDDRAVIRGRRAPVGTGLASADRAASPGVTARTRRQARQHRRRDPRGDPRRVPAGPHLPRADRAAGCHAVPD